MLVLFGPHAPKGFDSEALNGTIKYEICRYSQELISEEWFSGLNDMNKFHLFILIKECCQYFNKWKCDSLIQSAINKYIDISGFIDDEREKIRSNINKIINGVRQASGTTDYCIKYLEYDIDYIFTSARIHWNLAMGVAHLLGYPVRVSEGMEAIIDEFLEAHPEHWELISREVVDTYNYDKKYRFQSIEETERYLQNKCNENPNIEEFKILHEVFKMFVEQGEVIIWHWV